MLPTVQPVTATLALTGAVSLVIVPVGLWLRRVFATNEPRPERAVLLGTALSALPLALFGGVLKSTTHHRPLGGATFAVAALCVLAFCIGLAFRFSGGLRPAPRRSPWLSLFSLACLLSLGATLALGMAGAARPSSVDFSLLALACAATALLKIPVWLQRAKPAVLVLAWASLIFGAALALRSPGLARSLTTQTPVLFAPLSWLGVGS